MTLVLERVLISDSVDSSCRQILESGGVVVDYRPGLSKEELLVAIKVPNSYCFRRCVAGNSFYCPFAAKAQIEK